MKYAQKKYENFKHTRAKLIIDPIEDFLQEGETMLSVGDADGFVSLKMQERKNIRAHGIDIVEFPDIRVKEVPLTIYDSKNIPFADNSFDISSAIFVLHHCENIDSMLDEMIRVTRKKIIIIEDVYTNWFEHLVVKIMDYIENRSLSSEIPIPMNFQNVQGWEETFRKHHLKIETSRGFKIVPRFHVRHHAFCLIKPSLF